MSVFFLRYNKPILLCAPTANEPLIKTQLRLHNPRVVLTRLLSNIPRWKILLINKSIIPIRMKQNDHVLPCFNDLKEPSGTDYANDIFRLAKRELLWVKIKRPLRLYFNSLRIPAKPPYILNRPDSTMKLVAEAK